MTGKCPASPFDNLRAVSSVERPGLVGGQLHSGGIEEMGECRPSKARWEDLETELEREKRNTRSDKTEKEIREHGFMKFSET